MRKRIIEEAKRLVVIGAVLGAGGMLFAWSGLFDVAASSGHWKLTDWFLHWVMRNSVRTHALLVDVPAGGVQPAPSRASAAHFDATCAACHGSPARPRSPIVTAMLPPPPDLAPRIAEWSDAELFRIVKHGVKYTGMPAWPTLARDDEVWSMVAFLRSLPDLDGEIFTRLAGGRDGAPGAQLEGLPDGLASAAEGCARCHGRDGSGDGSIPRLAGQKEGYLLASLRAYRSGTRASGVMQAAASAVPAELDAELASFFGGRPLPPPADTAPRAQETFGRAQEIAEKGIPSTGVPPCLSCHGALPLAAPMFPRLEGQPENYLEAQLRLFQDGRRGGTPYAGVMATVARRLTDADIDALAAFFAARRGS